MKPRLKILQCEISKSSFPHVSDSGMSLPSVDVICTSFNVRDDIEKEIKSGGRRDETNRLIESWVLNVKLTDVVRRGVKEHPWLVQSKSPVGAASKTKTSFTGCAPVGFMVLGVRNVTAPKFNPESNAAPRMLKVTATDGYQTFQLVELEPCNKLSVDTAPGSKVILSGEFIVRNNLILIKRNNIMFVGGHVEEMYEKWQVNQRMALKGTSRELAMENSGAPKFVPFGCKIDQVGIDPRQMNKSQKDEGAKTEEDLKFDASREKKLEAVKNLKSELKTDHKTSGVATAQLPDREFFRKTPLENKDASKTGVESRPRIVANNDAVEIATSSSGARGGRPRVSGRRGRGGRNRSDSEEEDDTNGEFKRPIQTASLFDVIQNKMNEMSVTEKPKPGDTLATKVVSVNSAQLEYSRDVREEYNDLGFNRDRGFSRGGGGGDGGAYRGNRGGRSRYGPGHARARFSGDRGRDKNQQNFRRHRDVGYDDYEFNESDYPRPNQGNAPRNDMPPSVMHENMYQSNYDGNYYDQNGAFYHQSNAQPIPDMYVEPIHGFLVPPQNMMGNHVHGHQPFQGYPGMPPHFPQSFGDYDHGARVPQSNRGHSGNYQNREFTPRRGRYNSNNRY